MSPLKDLSKKMKHIITGLVLSLMGLIVWSNCEACRRGKKPMSGLRCSVTISRHLHDIGKEAKLLPCCALTKPLLVYLKKRVRLAMENSMYPQTGL